MSYLEAHPTARFTPPLVRFFKGRVLGTIKPGEMQAAARKLYPKAKGSTRNRQGIVPARAIINHAAALGWCQPIKVELFPVQKTKRRAVGRDWIDIFLARADRDSLPHLAAAVLFMWQTGTRVGEAVRVTPEHLNLTGRIVVLERTKTGEWEQVHITRELMIRLANLPLEPEQPIFGYADRFGITNRMKAVCRRAGLEYVSPHEAGRHSYATNSFAMGATVPQVMEGGRWKSARLLLETYAHAEHGGKAIADKFDANAAGTECANNLPHADARSCMVLRDKETG